MKVLIWDNFNLSDVGGPSGYCYQIHEYLRVHPCDKIVFLSDYIKNKDGQLDSVPNPKVLRKKYCWLLRPFVRLYNFVNVGLFISMSIFVHKMDTNLDWADFNEFDFIHFHSVDVASRFLHSHFHFKGKVILTSHCPCLYTDEIFLRYKSYYHFFRPLARYNEYCTYSKVDYLMFPCKDAREPYEKHKYLKRLFNQHENKFFYVPTSLLDRKADLSNVQHLSEIGIPNGSFVIAYFGRHTSIKGYDILQHIAENLLDQFDDLYFLCAGSGEIPAPKHPRWIELGFISNTFELLPQCDLYVLPNRETYFDIVTLECLRAGIRIAASATGGNRYFMTLPAEDTIGMTFVDIDDVKMFEAAVGELISLKHNNCKAFAEGGHRNRILYENKFNVEIFIHNYLTDLSKIHSNEKMSY